MPSTCVSGPSWHRAVWDAGSLAVCSGSPPSLPAPQHVPPCTHPHLSGSRGPPTADPEPCSERPLLLLAPGSPLRGGAASSRRACW